MPFLIFYNLTILDTAQNPLSYSSPTNTFISSTLLTSHIARDPPLDLAA